MSIIFHFNASVYADSERSCSGFTILTNNLQFGGLARLQVVVDTLQIEDFVAFFVTPGIGFVRGISTTLRIRNRPMADSGW